VIGLGFGLNTTDHWINHIMVHRPWVVWIVAAPAPAAATADDLPGPTDPSAVTSRRGPPASHHGGATDEPAGHRPMALTRRR
jgi:hypothetical protein